MIALEVTADGKRVCLAGAGEDAVVNAIVGWAGSPDTPGHIHMHVGGLDCTTDEHLAWEIPEIAVGSTVVVRVVEAAEVDEPKSRERRDLDSAPEQYRHNLLHFAAKLTPDERKQLLRELIAELEALG